MMTTTTATKHQHQKLKINKSRTATTSTATNYLTDDQHNHSSKPQDRPRLQRLNPHLYPTTPSKDCHITAALPLTFHQPPWTSTTTRKYPQPQCSRVRPKRRHNLINNRRNHPDYIRETNPLQSTTNDPQLHSTQHPTTATHTCIKPHTMPSTST
eukprot:4279178-Amphidinium_carterae.2